MSQKVLVTGARGQLGSDIIQCLKTENIDYIGIGRQEVDLTDEVKTKNYFELIKPDHVIHCAAYTAVDRAEQEPEICHIVNAKATEYVAKACHAVHADMIYLSTDYVFSGEGDTPYEIYDPKHPISIYGKSKLEGEYAVQEWLSNYFIVRISWIYGIYGANFVKTMLRLAQSQKEIRVVDDQVGSPTYTKDLAKLLCTMVQTKKYGIYHATNEGVCSWAEFAEEIFKLTGKNTKVCKISSEEYFAAANRLIAKRPHNSRLSKKSLEEAGFPKLPHWKDALMRYLKEEEKLLL